MRNGATWPEQAKLTASDAAAFDRFGTSVAISGETVVVGALSDDTPAGGVDSGSAYVFKLFRAHDDVVIGFGAGAGTWKWMNDSAWVVVPFLTKT